MTIAQRKQKRQRKKKESSVELPFVLPSPFSWFTLKLACVASALGFFSVDFFRQGITGASSNKSRLSAKLQPARTSHVRSYRLLCRLHLNGRFLLSSLLLPSLVTCHQEIGSYRIVSYHIVYQISYHAYHDLIPRDWLIPYIVSYHITSHHT